MRISIFGLGYVGAVSAACLARDGHTVIGVDPNRTKVDLINAARAPIVEAGLAEAIAAAVAAGRLRASTDVNGAMRDTQLSLLCVGTPSRANGSLDLSHVRRVCEQIGQALAEKDGYHVVVARSTMLPGTTADIVIPTLEECSGKRAGLDFGVCNNPEFLREGSAMEDYRRPPKTVIGEIDTRAGDALVELYRELDAPLLRLPLEASEMVKYADNAWHALKVCFANEIGTLCKGVGVDGHVVMDAFCRDTVLNLSPYYLKPGFAFGGSCLPKDVRALTYKGRELDLELPLLGAILPSNGRQLERAVKMVMDTGHKRIGVLGFSFKAGTDDLRESPVVELIERLIGKGYELRLYDRNVKLAALTGANRDYILNAIPHISRLMVDSVEAVLDFAQTVVVGNRAAEFAATPARLKSGQILVDLVRLGDGAPPPCPGKYQGIAW
ncbi:MAG: UDP-glucose/GDP-mannose dehydrogenase family protein [Betaproteobacteria bacterium]|nr:UDP-glucose/GDP-mannose dehydrogenase family protein [Betaproteobacteria bacterium]